MITEAITILVAVLVGWFLRDIKTKSIQKTAQKIKRKVLPNKSVMINWTPPESEDEELEKRAKENMTTGGYE